MSTRDSSATFGIGVVLGLVGLTLSTILALSELGRLEPFGCGEGSSCARVASGPFGRVPLLDLPWAFLGVVGFAGLTTLWIGSRRAVHANARHLFTLSAVVSVFLLAVMAVRGTFCSYCLGVHVSSLGLFLLSRRLPGTVSKRALAPSAIVALAVALGLFAVDSGVRDARSRAAGEELERSLAGAAGPEDLIALKVRHAFGPKVAPLRVLFYTDYQCPDCRATEGAFRAFAKGREDVAWSVKHFPLSTCNPRYSRNLHPDSCWAARAIETAAILERPEDVEALHEWLFARRGSFGWPDLEAYLKGRGRYFDAQRFFDTMRSGRVLERIEADCEEAYGLGLERTPLVVANGTVLRGWRSPDELVDALRKILARAPEARAWGTDEALTGPRVDLERWRSAPPVDLTALRVPEDEQPGVRPPHSAVLLLDVLAPDAARVLDALESTRAEERFDGEWAIVPVPSDSACNPLAPATAEQPGACTAARLLAALPGREALEFARRLVREPELLEDEGALQALLAETSSPPDLLERARSQAVLADVRRRIQLVRSRGLNQVPSLVVDGRPMPYRRAFFAGALELLLRDLETESEAPEEAR